MTTETITAPRRAVRDEEPEWVVWVMVLAMLVIGLIVRGVVTGRSEQFDGGSVTFKYPAGWINMADETPFTVAHVGESLDTGIYPASVRVQRMPVIEISTTAQTPGDLALKWSDRLAQDLLGFRVLNIEPASIGGQAAVRVNYAYVVEPALGGPRSIPAVARGEDILIPQGDNVTVASWAAASDEFDRQASTWQQILASLKLK